MGGLPLSPIVYAHDCRLSSLRNVARVVDQSAHVDAHVTYGIESSHCIRQRIRLIRSTLHSHRKRLDACCTTGTRAERVYVLSLDSRAKLANAFELAVDLSTGRCRFVLSRHFPSSAHVHAQLSDRYLSRHAFRARVFLDIVYIEGCFESAWQ